MKFLKSDQTFSQDLNAAALAFTTTLPSKPFKLEEIPIKFSQAVSETITISVDSSDGAAYDVVLQEVVLVAETDFVYRPQGQANYKAGDQIKVACTQTGGAGVATGKVKTSELR